MSRPRNVKAFQAANLEYMSCLSWQPEAAEAGRHEGTEGAAEQYMPGSVV